MPYCVTGAGGFCDGLGVDARCGWMLDNYVGRVAGSGDVPTSLRAHGASDGRGWMDRSGMEMRDGVGTGVRRVTRVMG